MDETALRLDPERLTELPERIGRNANALNHFRVPEAAASELPGSAVAIALHSVRATERLTAIAQGLTNWAALARASAAAFADTEQENARRLGGS